jgi:hypothetical protein
MHLLVSSLVVHQQEQEQEQDHIILQTHMNSVPVLTTSEKAECVLSSLKGTSIDPNNARRMEIKMIGDLEGQYTGPLPRGTGTICFRNGDTYLGELVDGEMHGWECWDTLPPFKKGVGYITRLL